jgi:hypothetical protein
MYISSIFCLDEASHGDEVLNFSPYTRQGSSVTVSMLCIIWFISPQGCFNITSTVPTSRTGLWNTVKLRLHFPVKKIVSAQSCPLSLISFLKRDKVLNKYKSYLGCLVVPNGSGSPKSVLLRVIWHFCQSSAFVKCQRNGKEKEMTEGAEILL